MLKKPKIRAVQRQEENTVTQRGSLKGPEVSDIKVRRGNFPLVLVSGYILSSFFDAAELAVPICFLSHILKV